MFKRAQSVRKGVLIAENGQEFDERRSDEDEDDEEEYSSENDSDSNDSDNEDNDNNDSEGDDDIMTDEMFKAVLDSLTSVEDIQDQDLINRLVAEYEQRKQNAEEKGQLQSMSFLRKQGKSMLDSFTQLDEEEREEVAARRRKIPMRKQLEELFAELSYGEVFACPDCPKSELFTVDDAMKHFKGKKHLLRVEAKERGEKRAREEEEEEEEEEENEEATKEKKKRKKETKKGKNKKNKKKGKNGGNGK